MQLWLYLGLSMPIFVFFEFNFEDIGLHTYISVPLKVGEKIGSSRVDKFGDTLKREALAGDGWRIRHDRLKMETRQLSLLVDGPCVRLVALPIFHT